MQPSYKPVIDPQLPREVANAMHHYFDGSDAPSLEYIRRAASLMQHAVHRNNSAFKSRSFDWHELVDSTLAHQPELISLLGGTRKAQEKIEQFYKKMSHQRTNVFWFYKGFEHGLRAISDESHPPHLNWASAIDDVSRRDDAAMLVQAIERNSEGFAELFKYAMRSSARKEVALWVRMALEHTSFRPEDHIVKSANGRLDVQESILRICNFCNEHALTPSGHPPFRRVGSKLMFDMMRPGMPDGLMLDNGTVKIGFASTSRDTQIEGTQFLRHSLELASVNSYLKSNLNPATATKEDYINGLRDYASNQKCAEDALVWLPVPSEEFRSIKSKIDSTSVEDIKERVAQDVVDLLDQGLLAINESVSSKEEYTQEVAALAERSTTWRNIIRVRLDGVQRGIVRAQDLVAQRFTSKDNAMLSSLTFFHRWNYATGVGVLNHTVPSKGFLSDLGALGELGMPEETEALKRISQVAKNYEGLLLSLNEDAYTAHMSTGGMDGVQIALKESRAFMSNICFSAGSHTITKRDRLAVKSLLALCFSQDDRVWSAMEKSLSDVRYDQNGSNTKKTIRNGIYKEDRNNFFLAMQGVFHEITETLKSNPSNLDRVLDIKFGKEMAPIVKQGLANPELMAKMPERMASLSLAHSEDGTRQRSAIMAAELAAMHAQIKLNSPTLSQPKL